MKSVTRILLAVLLVTVLTACGTTEYIDRPKYVYQEIPENLIPECYDRQFKGETIGDRLTWADKVEQDVDMCVIDVESLIEWRKNHSSRPD